MLRRINVEDLTQTLVVTGGSSGIGKEFIKQYLKHKPKVLVCNLSRSKPEFSKDFYNLKHFSADFSDPVSFDTARKALVEFLEENHQGGEIMLLNNSGFGSFGLFSENDAERDSKMIDVNVKAPMLLTASLFPLLRRYGGTVVNVASTAAYQPTPFFITYGASKAFLTNWSLGLWRECEGTAIKVVTVCPGPTSTDFFDNAGVNETPDGGRGMKVSMVVEKMIRAIQRRQPLIVVGFINRLIVSFAGILPNTWITRIAYTAIASLKLKKVK